MGRGPGRAGPSNLLITTGRAEYLTGRVGYLGPPKTLHVVIYAISLKQ